MSQIRVGLRPILEAYFECFHACYPDAIPTEPQQRDLQRFFFGGARTILSLAHAPNVPIDLGEDEVAALIGARVAMLQAAEDELDEIAAKLDADPFSWPDATIVRAKA